MDNTVLFPGQDPNASAQPSQVPPVGAPPQSQQIPQQIPFVQQQPVAQSGGVPAIPSPTQANPLPQPTQTTPSTGVPSTPLQGSFTLPNTSAPVRPVPVVPSQEVVQSADARADGPKITLTDLYGPSGHTEASVSQPVSLPEDPSQPPAYVAEETHLPLVENPTLPQSVETPLRETKSTVIVPSASKPVLLQEAPSSDRHGLGNDPESSEGGGGGFHMPPIIFKILGGLVVLLIVVVLISFISSLFKPTSDNGKVTLTYWGLWEDSNVFQSVINDFQRQNPNITVTYTKQDPVKYTDRLLTRIQNGSGPDIFRFHNTWVTPLQSVLLPLPSIVLDKKQLQDNYFPVMTTDLVRNGAIYGLPLQMDNLVLYTNKDIFDHAGAKVPATWEEFVTVSKGLTVKDSTGHIKTAGAAIGTYENVSHAPDIVSLLLLQNGARLDKLQGSQNATDALNFYTSFAKTDDRVWDSTLDTSLLAFARGKVAMYFGYSYDYFAIKAAAPQLAFEIHPVPHLLGRDMSIASYWVEGVSSKSKHQKEALRFLQYLSQKDVLAKLYTEEAKTRQFGEVYPRKDLANTLSADPILTPFAGQATKAVSSFFVGDTNYDGFNGGLNRYLGNAVNGLLNNTSADSALSTLAQGVTQIFNQYVSSSQ